MLLKNYLIKNMQNDNSINYNLSPAVQLKLQQYIRDNSQKAKQKLNKNILIDQSKIKSSSKIDKPINRLTSQVNNISKFTPAIFLTTGGLTSWVALHNIIPKLTNKENYDTILNKIKNIIFKDDKIPMVAKSSVIILITAFIVKKYIINKFKDKTSHGINDTITDIDGNF